MSPGNRLGRARRFALLGIALAAMVFEPSATGAATENVFERRARAFVKAYGYLRFFHPSDEAASIDWDRFAAVAARRVLDSDSDVAEALAEAFGPIAPTAAFVEQDTAGDLDVVELRSLIERATGRVSTSDEVVAWQHKGVGLSGGPLYLSVRTGRVTRVTSGAGFSSATQSAPPEALRGRRVRLTFSARADGADSRAQGWLRVDRPGGVGFFDNMRDRPITDGVWQRYSIEGEVAADAEAVVFGVMLTAGGVAWVDDVQLEVRDGDGWAAVDIVNGDFEDTADGALGWGGASPGFRHVVDDAEHASGERALRIERLTETLTELFAERPALGEMLDVEIAPGVRLRAPLALPADLVIHEAPGLIALREELRRAAGTAFDARRAADRLGNVAILWNVFQHFYPYFDVVPTDWEGVLDRAVERTLRDPDRAAHHETLRWLVAELHDGHGSVNDLKRPRQLAPLRLIEVEGRVFVDEVLGEPRADVRRGDEIVAVGARPVLEVLLEREELSSGSAQWRRVRALGGLVLAPAGGSLQLMLERSGESFEVEVPVGPGAPPPAGPESFRELETGIFYVDLRRLDWAALEPRLDELASAAGVVFDLRGYPNGNHAILQHLTDVPIQSAKWNVPLAIYPDHDRLVGYDTSGRWTLPPAQPRLGGRIVFLTDARAISYAESVMAIVKNLGLGQVVGSATAGTNGNVNPFELPGGFQVSWTGMKVVNHDDSQHHLIGVTPTLPARPTAAGVLGGRDEVLEAGLAVARGKR